MINLVILSVLIFCLSIFLQSEWIVRLRSHQIRQVQKSYGPLSHIETKGETPALGGMIFILASIISIPLSAIILDNSTMRLAQIWIYPLLAALVGLADDWLKMIRWSSEGLSSLSKLLLQIVISVAWIFWIEYHGGLYLVPGMRCPLWLALLMGTFFSVGMLNAVNVTDGLDGLAAGATFISLAALLAWGKLSGELLTVTVVGIAITLAFLWHNANPAKIFMGDIGSHFLAGLLIAICFRGYSLIMLIPVGALFGIEIISVSMQLLSIHLFSRKIFKMSPIHHHFELCGWSEGQIVVRFWLLHGVGIIVLLTIFGKLRLLG